MQSFYRFDRLIYLNIAGLAVGLAACLLMAGYVIHELSFETMHPFKDLVFRINERIPMGERVLFTAVVGAPLGSIDEESIPEIEKSVRILRRHNVPVQIEDREFKEKLMFFAEHEILKIFSFPLLRGDPNTALEAPFTVIIDESLAWKYFGDENPIGKNIRMALHRTYEFQVLVLYGICPPTLSSGRP